MPAFSVERVGRTLIRALIAAFTVAVIVLAQSAFWTGRAVSFSMAGVMVAIALASYFRPHRGLLGLAALAPLGQAGSRFLDSSMRGAEALVLAFLVGVLVRGWTLHRFRSVPSERLHIVALVLALIVTASLAEQLWFLQIQRDFAAPFYAEVLRYSTRRYLIAFDGYSLIYDAMLLLEGLALFVYAIRACRTDAALAPRLIVSLVLGAVAAALINIGAMWSQWQAGDRSVAALLTLLTQTRLSAHIGDLNAAGSFFAMNSVIALGMVVMSRRRAVAWLAAAVITVVAFWMTGSRTAVVATVLFGAILVVRALVTRPTRRMRTASALVLLVGFVISALLYFPAGFFSDTARYVVTTRWMFLGTTLRMVVWQPWSGVGIGQFALWSLQFSSPELLAIHPNRENAHNNFAQIAGELGMPGLLAFLWLLAASFRYSRDAIAAHPRLVPLVAGLAVFILTWLGGHPLLVPEAAYPFWMALGIVTGSAAPQLTRLSRGTTAGIALLVVLAVTLPLRIASKSDRVDFTRVDYGTSERTDRGGVPVRWTGTHARLFARSDARRVTLPLQGLDNAAEDPIQVDVWLNDRLAYQMSVTDSKWHRVELPLPQTRRRYHQIDVRVRLQGDPDEPPLQRQRPIGVDIGEIEMER